MTTTNDSPLFPPYPRKVATVTVTYKGAPVSLQMADASVQEVERLLDGLIERAGWDPPDKGTHAPARCAQCRPEARCTARRAELQCIRGTYLSYPRTGTQRG